MSDIRQIANYVSPLIDARQGVVDLREWSGLDLTGVNDNSSILTAAYAQAVSAGFPTVFAPVGDLRIAAAVTVLGGVHLAGAGVRATRFLGGFVGDMFVADAQQGVAFTDLTIDMDGQSDRGLYVYNGSSDVYLGRLRLKNLRAASAGSLTGGIHLFGVDDVDLELIQLFDIANSDRGSRAISLNNVSRASLARCYVQDSDKAYRIGEASEITVSDVRAKDLTDNFFYFLGACSGISVNGFMCDGCEEGVVFDSTSESAGIVVSNGMIRGATNKSVTIRKGGGYTFRDASLLRSGPIGIGGSVTDIGELTLRNVTAVDTLQTTGRAILLRYVRSVTVDGFKVKRTALLGSIANASTSLSVTDAEDFILAGQSLSILGIDGDPTAYGTRVADSVSGNTVTLTVASGADLTNVDVRVVCDRAIEIIDFDEVDIGRVVVDGGRYTDLVRLTANIDGDSLAGHVDAPVATANTIYSNLLRRFDNSAAQDVDFSGVRLSGATGNAPEDIGISEVNDIVLAKVPTDAALGWVRLEDGFQPIALPPPAQIDGVYPGTFTNNSGLTLTTAPGQVPDSGEFTFSMWMQMRAGSDGNDDRILTLTTGTGSSRLIIRRNSSNQIQVDAVSAAGSSLISAAAGGTVDVAAGGVCVMVSASNDHDGLGTTRLLIYVNDTEVYDGAWFAAGDIGFNAVENWYFAQSASAANYLSADLTNVWFDAQYIDLTVESQRRKFLTSGGDPAFLGVYGELPVGGRPAIYAGHPTPTSDWQTGDFNYGYLGGGPASTWTKTGAGTIANGTLIPGFVAPDNVTVVSGTGDVGGAGSAGVGNQYVGLRIDGVVYKLLHDGTI